MKKILPFLVVIMLLVVACGSSGGDYRGDDRSSFPTQPPDEHVEEVKVPTLPTLPPDEHVEEVKVPVKPFTDPNAEIDEVWLDHNTWQGDVKGMVIHTSFSIYALEDTPCRAVAYFYFKNGEPLKDFNGKYKTEGGNVSVGKDFTPGYNKTRYDDLAFFMPYEELHMAPGEHSLKLRVTIWWTGVPKEVGQSDWVYFTYTGN
jgi:hypothetical protein